MKEYVKTAVLITLIASLAMAVSALQSCKKEEKTSPTVSFFTPYANQWFGFGDSIFVDANVSHPEMSRITLTLVDENFQPIEEVVPIGFSGTQIRFQEAIPITNKNIETGIYHVRIQVAAQGESYNYFVQVQIGELVKERKAIYVASSDGLNKQLFRIENGQQTLSHSLFGDASAVAANSFYGGVFLAPEYFGDLRLFAPLQDSLIWKEDNNASGGAAFMRNLYSTGNTVFGLYQNGKVVRYGNFGGVSSSFQLPNGEIPLHMLVMESYLIVVSQNPPQSGFKIFYLNASSGSVARTISLPAAKVFIGIYPYDVNQFVVLYNDVNDLATWDSYLLNGTFVALPNLPSFQFNCAVETGSGEFALGTNQGIYYYKRSTSGYLPLANIQPELLEFDVVLKQIMVGAGNSLSIRTFPGMQVLSSFTYPTPVKGISVLYNK